MVTERALFEDSTDDPALTVLEQRYAVAPRLPATAVELVHLIAGLATEQLCELMLGRREHVDGEHRGASRHVVRVVLHRQAHQEPRWADTRLGSEAHEAAGLNSLVGSSHHEHRVVQTSDEPVEFVGLDSLVFGCSCHDLDSGTAREQWPFPRRRPSNISLARRTPGAPPKKVSYIW